MAGISPEFVERYQIEYQKNPKSRIFAPLAEAYRQMGMLDEAFKICSKGVQLHPDFAGGRVAYAKIFIARRDLEKANEQLEKAVQISPDNLLAQNVLGENLLELRRPKDALKAFKMVLFLNPEDDRALKAVQKWEFLSADEYDEELFKMRPVFEAVKAEPTREERQAPMLEPEPGTEPGSAFGRPRFELTVDPVWKRREIERAVSLADAFTVRNDMDRAIAILRDASRELGPAPDIDKRLRLLAKRAQVSDASSDGSFDGSFKASPEAALFTEREKKRVKLESLLQRIIERRT